MESQKETGMVAGDWRAGNLLSIAQEGYPGMGGLFAQVWQGDDLIARVYGNTREEVQQRAARIAATPSAETIDTARIGQLEADLLYREKMIDAQRRELAAAAVENGRAISLVMRLHAELHHSHTIIGAKMLNLMTTEQKVSLGHKTADIAPNGTTRAHERESLLAEASAVLEKVVNGGSLASPEQAAPTPSVETIDTPEFCLLIGKVVESWQGWGNITAALAALIAHIDARIASACREGRKYQRKVDEKIIARLRAQQPAQAVAAKPIAWVVECMVSGEWVPQYPARFTREQAEEDASMYGQTERRVTALIAAPLATHKGKAGDGKDGERLDFTEAQISAAGRVLADRHAAACNVDKDDNWKIYGDEFIADARAALAALAAMQAQQAGKAGA